MTAKQTTTIPAGVTIRTTTPVAPVASALDQPTARGFVADFLPADFRVGQMRRITAAHLRLWDLTALIDTATLIVSELVTNALLHGKGQPVGLRVTCPADELRIEVTDGTQDPARLCSAGGSDEHGRGLLLVDELAQDWGVSPDGTLTWCSLAIPEKDCEIRSE